MAKRSSKAKPSGSSVLPVLVLRGASVRSLSRRRSSLIVSGCGIKIPSKKLDLTAIFSYSIRQGFWRFQQISDVLQQAASVVVVDNLQVDITQWTHFRLRGFFGRRSRVVRTGCEHIPAGLPRWTEFVKVRVQ